MPSHQSDALTHGRFHAPSGSETGRCYILQAGPHWTHRMAQQCQLGLNEQTENILQYICNISEYCFLICSFFVSFFMRKRKVLIIYLCVHCWWHQNMSRGEGGCARGRSHWGWGHRWPSLSLCWLGTGLVLSRHCQIACTNSLALKKERYSFYCLEE